MGIWGLEQALVLGLCFCSLFYREKHWLLRLVVLYAGISAFRIFLVPSPYSTESPEWVAVFDHNATLSLLIFTLITHAAYSVPLRHLLGAFQFVAIVNFFSILIGALWGAPYGVLVNPSMSGCFAVVLLPLFFDGLETPWISVALTGLAVGVVSRSQPLGVLALCLMVFAIRSRMWRVVAGLPMSALMVGLLLKGTALFDSSGRFDIWSRARSWWILHANHAFGAGSGSFAPIGAYLTKDFPPNSTFIWLHSDWGQILFEQGTTGLALAVAVMGYALYLSKKRSYFYALLAYAFWMIANMPMRYPLSALYGVVLIRWAFEKAPIKKRTPHPNYWD